MAEVKYPQGQKLVETKKAPKQNKFATEQAKRVVFVGDTHGDLEASQKVIKDYLKEGNKIVFLGDYVDRGAFSKENLDFLLKTKQENPESVYLLQGNHEGHRILKFFPAEFWKSLDEKEYEKYGSLVEKLPLALATDDIIALHGAPPDVESLAEINKIGLGSEEWRQIVWGDLLDEEGEYLGMNLFTGRPQFGRDYFFKIMKRFNKKVLIRSHQPNSPQFMFDDKCLTIFTSSAYIRERTIAIADLTKKVKNAKDLEIVRI